jgi:hypothetical protein
MDQQMKKMSRVVELLTAIFPVPPSLVHGHTRPSDVVVLALLV